MAVFAEYSRCYDLLYAGKDYGAEAEYVAGHIRSIAPRAHWLMELGCGTGRHARQFAAQGFKVRAFDLSADMIEIARHHEAKEKSGARFEVGDVRSVRVDQKFDATYSLFHVMSYQTTDDDLANAFRTAAWHTEQGGAFVFDCWFGPGVLTDLPQVRVKRVEDEGLEILRIAEPTIFPLENVVQVDYSLRVHSKSTGEEKRVTESHRMRYLFVPEVKALLESAGFELCGVYKWMTDEAPTLDAWNAMFAARRV